MIVCEKVKPCAKQNRSFGSVCDLFFLFINFFDLHYIHVRKKVRYLFIVNSLSLAGISIKFNKLFIQHKNYYMHVVCAFFSSLLSFFYVSTITWTLLPFKLFACIFFSSFYFSLPFLCMNCSMCEHRMLYCFLIRFFVLYFAVVFSFFQFFSSVVFHSVFNYFQWSHLYRTGHTLHINLLNIIIHFIIIFFSSTNLLNNLFLDKVAVSDKKSFRRR